MMQYLITALAGLAVGIAGMRIWQALKSPAGETAARPGSPAETPVATPAFGGRKLLIGAGILTAIGAAIIAFRPDSAGGPSASDQAGGASGATAAGGKQLDDVDTMIGRLASRLQANPGDGEGWRMLGWSYVMTGHPDKAIEPYRKALALLPRSATVHAGYGEALAAVAANRVTPEAKSEFDKALAIDAKEPRARYFAALWLAQNGKEREALEQWITLANSGPSDAHWQGDVRKQISEVSRKLGIDVTGRLKQAAANGQIGPAGPDAAAMQAAAALPEGQRQAMVDQMVEGLASKLKANPHDVDGWIRLLRSRMVLRQDRQAGEDLVAARKALAGSASSLAQLNEAASQFGVPGGR